MVMFVKTLRWHSASTLGVRVCRKVCRLSGGGGGGEAHELGEKKEKRLIRTCTKMRPACHVVHALPMRGQAVYRW